MLSLAHPQPPAQIVPKDVHNQDATIWSLAKQMLMDLDRRRETTTVPTPTLALLLTTLVDSLDRAPAPRIPATAPGAMFETTSNPNLAYLVRKAADELDAADNE